MSNTNNEIFINKKSSNFNVLLNKWKLYENKGNKIIDEKKESGFKVPMSKISSVAVEFEFPLCVYKGVSVLI